MLLFLFLWAIESLGALFFLVYLPTDPKNATFLGFSLSRLGLILVSLASLVFSAGLVIRYVRNGAAQATC